MRMAYFIEGFDVNDARKVLRWLKEDFDGDRWGWAMSVAFDIAAELYNRGDSVPFDIYRPGACASMQEVSEYRAEGMAEVPSDTLYTVGLVIDRYLDKLKLAGVDY